MSTAAAISAFFILALMIILPFVIGVYVCRDARRRGMNAILWTLIATLVPSLIGLLIYLLVRGNYSDLRCPQCGTPVKEQFVICPKCGAKLRPACPNCAAPVEPDWKLCPKCTQPLPEMQTDIQYPVHAKDQSLWKVLVIVILVPALLITVFGFSLAAFSAGGGSAVRGVTTNEYFAEMDENEKTEISNAVEKWVEQVDLNVRSAYALRYTYESESGKQHFFLIYIPFTGAQTFSGVGQSSSIFGTTLTLNASSASGRSAFFNLISSADNVPKLIIKLDGKRIPCKVTTVEFNPTLFYIE